MSRMRIQGGLKLTLRKGDSICVEIDGKKVEIINTGKCGQNQYSFACMGGRDNKIYVKHRQQREKEEQNHVTGL